MSAVISLGLASSGIAGDFTLKPQDVAKWKQKELLGRGQFGMVILAQNPDKDAVWPDYAIVTVHNRLGLIAYAYLDRNGEVVVIGYNPKMRQYQRQPTMERANKTIKDFLLAQRKNGGA
jgi:hypothetical protein